MLKWLCGKNIRMFKVADHDLRFETNASLMHGRKIRKVTVSDMLTPVFKSLE